MRVDFDNWKKGLIFVVPIRRFRPARMAESVDALVSNTNDSNVVPVRPRLRVRRKIANSQIFRLLAIFIYDDCSQIVPNEHI